MSAAPLKKVPIHLQSSHNRLIIKNGKIVNANGMTDGDVFIEGGIIKDLGRNLIIPGGTRAIDARGKYVFPGGIDPNTHLEQEFTGALTVDNFYQGTKASVAGGTTTVIDFVTPKRDQSLLEAYYERREQADDKVCCDYALHVAVTNTSDKTKKEMAELVKEELGVNSFMFYMAYKDSLILRDPQLYQLFDHCRKIGALALVHAENGDVISENVQRLLAAGVTGPDGHQRSRPEDVEAEAVTRAEMIANQVGCPLYVTHVMSKEAAEVVALARSRGNVLFGEVIAAALATDGRVYKKDQGAEFILSPPLRADPATPETLLRILNSGDLQVVSSDHRVFSQQQKAAAKNFSLIPDGVNGAEERLSVVWQRGYKNGVIDLPQFVSLTSTNAAKLFNLFPRKGAIAIGSDADIVIWDPTPKHIISAKSHHSAGDFNIFEGQEIQGSPQYVIVNGRVCVDDYELKAVQGHGRFLKTAPWTPFVYEQVKAREELRGIIQNDIPNLQNPSVAPANPASLQQPASRTLKQEEPLIPGPPLPPPATGRQMRQVGQRDMQGSSFTIGGESCESTAVKSSVRVANPPGGRSSGGFW